MMGYNFKRKYGTNTRGGGVDPDPMNFFVNTCLILCINRIIVCIQNNRCRTTVRATVITANRCNLHACFLRLFFISMVVCYPIIYNRGRGIVHRGRPFFLSYALLRLCICFVFFLSNNNKKIVNKPIYADLVCKPELLISSYRNLLFRMDLLFAASDLAL